MPSSAPQKVEILNPNTGRGIKIDKNVYDLFSKAIYHTLKSKKELTYTELVDGVNECFKKQKTKFDGSVGWYTVSVKHDMHARGVIEVFTDKGKKLHRLKKS
jgi:hypothetical protein